MTCPRFLSQFLARVVAALMACPVLLGAAPTREYQVKAVFLYNFAQFVDWPPEAFATPKSPLVIGVLGADPFGPLLEDAVRDERVEGRPIVVKRFAAARDAQGCHILFIAEKQSARFREILAALLGQPILTVGETDGFALSGGVIRFVTDRGKVRLRINVDAARAARLKISSKLLRPAEIVGSPGNTP